VRRRLPSGAARGDFDPTPIGGSRTAAGRARRDSGSSTRPDRADRLGHSDERERRAQRTVPLRAVAERNLGEMRPASLPLLGE